MPKVINAECLQAMAEMADNSVDAIITDPPYFKVKNEAWDQQWDKPNQFIAWIGKLCEEWQRILKPNGSLYVFASPKMSARVEVEIGRWFNVLNCARWTKAAGWHNKTVPEDLRSFLSPWESIIFAEHFSADNMAKGEAGYVAKCDELRGFIFEPLRAYLDGERGRAGWTTRRVAEEYQKKTGSRTVTGMAGHWFGAVQWALPTEENYNWLRALFNASDGDYLRREYDYLRREYEDLRRPFSVTADVPYTDVWDFKTVAHYPGKHPCEKPAALMEHIVSASTRPGAVVLDCFMGTGSTGIACQKLGREFIGIEMSPEYCTTASKRLAVKHLF